MSFWRRWQPGWPAGAAGHCTCEAERLGLDAGAQELIAHPFWNFRLPERPMPAEPALEAFIERNSLRPKPAAGVRESQTLMSEMLRSVNVNRMSAVARNNLDKESDGQEYTAATAGPTRGDVRLENADAELDFEVRAGGPLREVWGVKGEGLQGGLGGGGGGSLASSPVAHKPLPCIDTSTRAVRGIRALVSRLLYMAESAVRVSCMSCVTNLGSCSPGY